MSDAMYEADFVVWSEQQAEALRRLQRGERTNDVDWGHLIEEVEDLGRSATNAVRTLLLRGLEHLLKVAAWPDTQSSGHWQSEAALFLANAEAQFAPSMGQKLDLPRLYTTALRSVRLIDRIDGLPPGHLRPDCPFTLTELFAPDLDVRAAAASLRDGTGRT